MIWDERPALNLTENNVSGIYSIRHGNIGTISCIYIKEMKNEKYWFKSCYVDDNAIYQEYQTMNLLKSLNFPYIASDYAFYVDAAEQKWLITKHEGTSINDLLRERKITQRQHKNIIRKVRSELSKIKHKYRHPGFFDRNIVYDRKRNVITLIDFEDLGH